MKINGWKVLDFFFPPKCIVCGEWGRSICSTCFNNIQPIKGALCRLCGEPMSHSERGICPRCQNKPPAFREVRSWAYFDKTLQKAIHRLKYGNDIGLGRILAVPLAGILQESSWNIDLITAVPLDSVRYRERGFNQSLFIARPLSKMTGIPLSVKAIRKVKRTPSQVGLTLDERAENLYNAFWSDESLVAGKDILVIDDVVTTGSTLNACAQSLLQSNANRVYGLTPARKVRNKDG